MNINTKVKENTMAYICANTIDVAIGKGFVEVSRTDSKFALVVFALSGLVRLKLTYQISL